MDSEDGLLFIRNLAFFVRTHEKSLANALQRQRTKESGAAANAEPTPKPITLSDALSRPYLSFTHRIKPAKLALTPHHLYYLLHKFEDLGVDVGPMNVRLENLQHDAAPSNYVSFLGRAPRLRGRQSDADSLRSVSSVQSVMSSMSTLWANLTLANSAAKAERRMAQHHEDIKYLYSCFTKIPALKLSPDPHARMISGYEEFPLDTAVPLFAFKNVSALEISDLDFRKFHGWDRLAEQLRSLTVKRANVADPIDLLQNIVLDDIERRRKRSSNPPVPTTPSTSGLPWPQNSPRARQIELARTYSAPGSPLVGQRRGSTDNPASAMLARGGSSDGSKPSTRADRQRSNSPTRVVPVSRYGSLKRQSGGGSFKNRRSSGSSGSSTHETTPGHSTADLLSMGFLPASKWRFLKHLSLSENGMIALTAASLAPVAGTLQSLDLSGNEFTEVPDALASLTHLRALNLSGCMIQGLKTLSHSPLPAITILNLRSNRLRDLAGIERLLSLERIDLRDNDLHDPDELARLTAMPEIRDIYVAKNPFVKTRSDYRITIFNLFRSTPGRSSDITIDGTGPNYYEKKLLVPMAPEPAIRPVLRPAGPEDDENFPPTFAGANSSNTIEPTDLELQALALVQQGFSPPNTTTTSASRLAHRRATSDFGPETLRRKKKPTRRRIVELSPTEPVPQPPPPVPATLHEHAPEHVSELPPDLSDPTPKTPTDSDQPSTPSETPSAPQHPGPGPALTQTQTQTHTGPPRPRLATAFPLPLSLSLSPPAPEEPPPKIRDPSDDEEGGVDVPPAGSLLEGGEGDVYAQKVGPGKEDMYARKSMVGAGKEEGGWLG